MPLRPLVYMWGCLRDTISNLSLGAVNRGLQPHRISRLPAEDTKEQRKRFSSTGDFVLRTSFTKRRLSSGRPRAGSVGRRGGRARGGTGGSAGSAAEIGRAQGRERVCQYV